MLSELSAECKGQKGTVLSLTSMERECINTSLIHAHCTIKPSKKTKRNSFILCEYLKQLD